MSVNLIDPTRVLWDDWILFGAQLLTLFALVIYVWKTWEMARATREAALASARAVNEAIEARMEAMAPRILVYFGSEHLLWAEVVVENRGQGTAEELSIVFEPPLESSSKTWSPNRFFESVKPVVRPGYRMVHSFDFWSAYLSSKTPKRYVVRLSYSGKENRRRYSETHVLDVAAIEGRSEFTRKSLDDVVKQMEKATKALETGFKALHTVADLGSAIGTYETEPTRSADAMPGNCLPPGMQRKRSTRQLEADFGGNLCCVE